MAVLTKIHGFDRDAQSFSSEGVQLKVREIVLIEAETPELNIAEVIDAMPNTLSGPGTIAFNPDQLTFTLFHSRHPYSDNYYLESVQGMKRKSNGDRFWVAPLMYSTPPPPPLPRAAAGGARAGKKNQKVKRPDGKKKDQKAITNPMERPPDFTGSTKTIIVNRYHDLQNRPIYHTNGIPISKPVPFAVDAVHWTWSWNIAIADYGTFFASADTLVSSANNADVTLSIGNGGSVVIGKHTMKCTGVTYDEQWETPSSAVEYHYVRVTASFMITQGIKWGLAPLSNHTLQRILVNGITAGTEPIPVGPREDQKAKTPWPLQADGTAVPYAQILTFNRDNLGKLQAGGNDLKTIEFKNHTAFFAANSLHLPRIDM